MIPVRILLVEDNPGDVELLNEVLSQSKVRLHLDIVDDGVEALSLLRRCSSDDTLPNLILLDLNMPRVDGRDFLRAIKQEAAWSHIPIVVLTSSDAESDIARSYSDGASCYVTKPVSLEGLRQIALTLENFWLTLVRLP